MINHTIYGGIVQLSGNKIEIDVTNDDLKGESPRALLKATNTDGSVPGGPFVDSKPWTVQVDESGLAVFDFSEYFDTTVDYDFTFPAGNVKVVKHPLRAFDLNILAGGSYIDNDPLSETYREKVEEWQTGDGVAIRILKGGMSQQRQAEYTENATNFYEDFIQGNKWLTHRPDNQRIAYNQPVRLWYLLPETESVTRTLKVDYTAADDSITTLSFAITIDPDGLYEFILDPEKLGIPTDAKQFSVYQFDTAQVGEKRTFVIDPDYYENNTFLFFANSLAGIDDVWFTGAVKTGLGTDGETGQQSLDRTATTKSRSVVVTSKSGQRKWSIFVGNRLEIADMEYLQDLLYSKFIWLVVEGKLVPVNLENGDFELTDTKRDLVINDELELIFTEANQNNHF